MECQTQALAKAIEVVGTQAALAKALGVTQQAVSYWVTTETPVPAEYCGAIEKATAGEVKRAQLRPDIFGELG